MKKILLFMLVYVVSVAFAQTHEIIDELHDNGYPKSIKTYRESMGKLEIMKETQWYEDGKQKEKGAYKNGQRNGKWTMWHENGHKE
ncbi:uncharacterized protein METZ01_LOCUS488010, partial [marine metagenome]